MAFNKKDMLATKKKELESYNTMFGNAVSVITSTIVTLENINESVGQKIQEIEEYQNELEETKNGLNSTKSKNEGIIKNFKALLGE